VAIVALLSTQCFTQFTTQYNVCQGQRKSSVAGKEGRQVDWVRMSHVNRVDWVRLLKSILKSFNISRLPGRPADLLAFSFKQGYNRQNWLHSAQIVRCGLGPQRTLDNFFAGFFMIEEV
jgi:hypothetical protein